MNTKVITLVLIPAVIFALSGFYLYYSWSNFYKPKTTAADTTQKKNQTAQEQAAESTESVNTTTLVDSLKENPTVKKVLEANPEIEKAVQKADVGLQQAEKMCVEFNDSGFDTSMVTVEMLKPTYGDKAQNYLDLIKKTEAVCKDGKISAGESLELASMMSKLDIDTSQLGL